MSTLMYQGVCLALPCSTLPEFGRKSALPEWVVALRKPGLPECMMSWLLAAPEGLSVMNTLL